MQKQAMMQAQSFRQAGDIELACLANDLARVILSSLIIALLYSSAFEVPASTLHSNCTITSNAAGVY